jgi:hypothetical protein
VLEKKITLNIKDTTITCILDKVSAQANVFFSYDAILIEAGKVTSLSVDNRTIRESLDTLFHSKFSYKTLGDQIIITEPEGSGKLVASSAKKGKTILFKGRVFDRDQKDVLPYSSISVLGTTLSTVSNSDGDFELKIPGTMNRDTVVVSCLGYRQYRQPVAEIEVRNYLVYLQPVSIQLREIKVTVINPDEIINRILSKLLLNYPRNPEIMNSFYREVLKQDDDYIDVAEAVMEIRKAPYDNSFAEDRVKLIKGRKNLNVKPFQFVDFKIQGGPYYITKLDVVKTLDSFLDPEFREFYKYSLYEIIDFEGRETYVIGFKPKDKVDYPCYQGKLFVDMSTFALVRAEFSLSRSGLNFAHQSLIKKKPKDFYVRPTSVEYKVNYRRVENRWHLSTAQVELKFKVKSKLEKINSTFYSNSELLVTDFKPEDGTHFRRAETFNSKDIFSELITSYDEGFWDEYNIIKPSEELTGALKRYYLENDSLFKINSNQESILIKNNIPEK